MRYNNEQAVVYARYSSHNQTEQSIEGQLAAAREYADKHDYTIVHEYCDRAKTGTNDNREAFQQMLSDCAKKQFTVILVWKIDRFGRNREEIAFNKYKARKNGVRVEYVAENIPDSPEGVILESVMEGMAEYYSLQLAQNVKRGLLESAKKHHVVCGNLPLGYNAGPNKEYVINEAEAEAVKRIYDLYAAGNTKAEVAEMMNNAGYRTKNGNKFTHDSLTRILKNERYTGTYIYKDLIREENVIPPIVSKEKFDQAQKMLAHNHKRANNKWNYADYLLTEKLHCGCCGASMFGRSGHSKTGAKYNYYVCADQYLKKGCHKKPIRQDVLDEYVMDRLQILIADDAMIEYITDVTYNYYITHDQSRRDVEALEARLHNVEGAIANIIRSIEEGLPYSAVKRRMEELNEEKEELEKKIADVNIKSGIRIERDYIYNFLKSFQRMDIKNDKIRMRLVDVFVNAIYVYEDKVTVALNYSSNKNEISIDDIKEASQAETSVRPVRTNQGFVIAARTLVCKNVLILECEW